MKECLLKFCSVELPLQVDQVEKTTENLCNDLHICASRSRRNTTHEVDNPVLERWERLVQSKDDLNLWRAINWRREYVHDFHNDALSVDEYKQYFEHNYAI